METHRRAPSNTHLLTIPAAAAESALDWSLTVKNDEASNERAGR